VPGWMYDTWQVYYKRANRKGTGITVDLQGAQVLQRNGHKRQFIISAGARRNKSPLGNVEPLWERTIARAGETFARGPALFTRT